MNDPMVLLIWVLTDKWHLFLAGQPVFVFRDRCKKFLERWGMVVYRN
jgi:hypothetical protein